MDQKDLSLLFAYNRWANAKVLAACQYIPEEQLHAPADLSFGSLFGTLAHILGAEVVWRARLESGVSPTAVPNASDFSNLEALMVYWQAEEVGMQAFIGGLTEEDVSRWVEFRTTSGSQQGTTLWKALMQVALHGMQFRAEAGVVLAGLGHSPGDLDFILYLREIDQR